MCNYLESHNTVEYSLVKTTQPFLVNSNKAHLFLGVIILLSLKTFLILYTPSFQSSSFKPDACLSLASARLFSYAWEVGMCVFIPLMWHDMDPI